MERTMTEYHEDMEALRLIELYGVRYKHTMISDEDLEKIDNFLRRKRADRDKKDNS